MLSPLGLSRDLGPAGIPPEPAGPQARWVSRVVASDLDPRWLAGRVGSGVEVVRQDVARDDPPGDAFDLVHARLVLSHVVEREEALRRMVSALRPEGWVLVEDYDVGRGTMSGMSARPGRLAP